MRRTLIVTSASILSSFRRIVPQVVSARRVSANPMRRNALIFSRNLLLANATQQG